MVENARRLELCSMKGSCEWGKKTASEAASSEKKRASDEVEKPKLKAEDDVVAAVWNELKARQQAVTQLDAGNDAESDCKSERRLRLVAAARTGTTKTVQEEKRDAAQAAGILMKAENEAGGGAAAQRARTT